MKLLRVVEERDRDEKMESQPRQGGSQDRGPSSCGLGAILQYRSPYSYTSPHRLNDDLLLDAVIKRPFNAGGANDQHAVGEPSPFRDQSALSALLLCFRVHGHVDTRRGTG